MVLLFMITSPFIKLRKLAVICINFYDKITSKHCVGNQAEKQTLKSSFIIGHIPRTNEAELWNFEFFASIGSEIEISYFLIFQGKNPPF
jgi:hypothetical protein